MQLDETKCAAAGLSPVQVASIMRRISSAADEAKRIGLIVWGDAGAGTLRIVLEHELVTVAELDGRFGDDGPAW